MIKVNDNVQLKKGASLTKAWAWKIVGDIVHVRHTSKYWNSKIRERHPASQRETDFVDVYNADDLFVVTGATK